jgi:uncharacterized membrane protein
MSALVKDRWFPLIELMLVLFAGVLFMVGGYYVTWQPLLLALTPFGVRIAAGKHLYRRSLVDSLVIAFLITAIISMFFAYDLRQTFQKLFILINAILLLYALMAQSRRDIWTVAAILSFISVGIVGYFLQTNDWNVLPADIDIINRIGLRWMGIRPYLPIPVIHANAAGGIVAIIIPFQIALARYARRVNHQLYWWIAIGTGLVSLVGILFTSSRGAWVGLTFAFLLWQLWVQTEKIAIRFQRSHFLTFSVFAIGMAVIGAALLVAIPERLLGLSTLNTRLTLDNASYDLIGDFPFFGAGLASFGGLYSQYIAVQPFFLFNYGHFFWLDMVLEQGVVGLLMWMGIYAVGGWLLYKMPDKQLYIKSHRVGYGRSRRRVPTRALDPGLFKWAVVLSTITHLIHTLVDDPLYAYLGTPFLFLLPGLSLMVAGQQNIPSIKLPELPRVRMVQFGVASVVVLGLTFVVLRRPILGNWFAMQGALEMARIELTDWPQNEWDYDPDLDGLTATAAHFERALAIDPTNRTAHHRLGLIAMQKWEFETAVTHLEAANEKDPEHIGIMKSLGFSYLWLGEYDLAAQLLTQFPETVEELDEYIFWWGVNGRSDLSDHASNMFDMLSETSPVSTTNTNDSS